MTPQEQPRRRGLPRWAVAAIAVAAIAALALGGLLASGRNPFGASAGGAWTITFSSGGSANLNLSQSFWTLKGSITDGEGLSLPVAGSVSGQHVMFGGSYSPIGAGMNETYSFTGVVSSSGAKMSGTDHVTLRPSMGAGKTVSSVGTWTASRT